ncbi:uncharacterized protein BDV17DRAFT_4240 [Aspergillus undulatus]|uniref:uncharacterized protein n=1 Tax=Aspergillus undulatus TaxID=1810928 RepID=UPI003CCCC3C8
MFLLAKLGIDYLMGHPSVGELEEALATLPYGTEGLGAAYDQAIKRIQSQSNACVQMAIKVLSWLTYSKRALYATELQHVLRPDRVRMNLTKDFSPPSKKLIHYVLVLSSLIHTAASFAWSTIRHRNTQQ